MAPVRNLLPMDRCLGPAIPRSLLVCLAASLAGHAIVLFLVSRSEVPRPHGVPADRTLLIALEGFTPEEGPADGQEPIAPTPDTARPEEPEPRTAAAAIPALTRDTPEAKERPFRLKVSPLDLRNFVKSYEPNEEGTDPLPFRPNLRRGLEVRQAEQRRVALVEKNRDERLGHSEIVNADGAMTRIGDDCYMTSLPTITIQRGLQVSRVGCPGRVEWWKRSDLDDVATFRGIP